MFDSLAVDPLLTLGDRSIGGGRGIVSCPAMKLAVGKRIAFRSFSLTLALRYLNPKRTHLSPITLVSMVGVAVGVLVLIVVLAVMAGFEREVKTRLLGSSPHVTVRLAPGGFAQPITDWKELSEKVEKVGGVVEASAQLRDYTVLEFRGNILPVEYRAIDTTNKLQISELEGILKDGVADMGLDEKAVIAETTAKEFGIKVGEVVQLHSTRNLQELARAWRITDRPLLAIENADLFEGMQADLAENQTKDGDRESYEFNLLRGIYETIGSMTENVRPTEQSILNDILYALAEAEPAASEERRVLPAGTLEAIGGHFQRLGELDKDKEDAAVLRSFREVALPKELLVIGIFKASARIHHPKVFLPLPTGQELKNLDNDAVEAVGIKVEDPYRVQEVKERLQAALPPEYHVVSWMDENHAFVELIAKERMMMYFALSFIMLVSAFCIGAVMFTVTIQKKQEIGVMKALGAVPGQVVLVFVYQGIVIGLLGAISGVLLGLLVIANRKPIHEFLRMIGFDPFPADVHHMEAIPAHVNLGDVFTVAGAAFVVCVLATILPAVKAARSDAARCLRGI